MSKTFDVTLSFRSKDQREEFMSQLSDGWGEPYVGLKWLEGIPFDEATQFFVEVFEEEDDDA
jgi:hypothetical protein